MPAAGRREPPEAESQAGPKRRCPPDEARFSWEPRRGSVPARGGSAAGSMRSPQGHRGGSWAAPWSGTREHRPAAPPTVPSSAERPTAHGRQIDPRVDLWGAALDLPSRPQGQALSPAYEERHTCSAEHIFRHARTAPPRQPPDHAPGAVAAPGAAVGSAGPRASAGRPSSQGQRGARGIRACPMPSAEPGTAASSTYVDLVLADWEVELVKHMRAVSFLDSVVRTHGLERDVEQIAAARQRHESEEERIIRVTYEGLRSEEMAKRFMEAERQRDDQEERHETSVPETSVPAGQQEAADPPRAAPAPMPCVVPGAGGAAPERLPEARQVPTPELSLGREQANHPGSGFPNPGEKSAGAEGDRGPNADMF
uniref:Uncharacterized protein n=1 Tax=Tetraselmis sp. GSL018 TaxID=582737 RepID=A0A061QZ21_9CHLO